MKIGVIKTSLMENEKRIPIYPKHFGWIPASIRKNLWLESSYGEDYGYPDDYFLEQGANLAGRSDIFETCDILILPKPTLKDVDNMKANQILWGWAHCVQQQSIAQMAIKKKLTLVTWENMHQWSPAGEKLMHVFYRNNELAGYCAVIHMLHLQGIDGLYGERQKVVVFGYGSVSKGAIYALHGRGFNNINVLTARPTHLVMDKNPDVFYQQYIIQDNGEVFSKKEDGEIRPIIDELANADIIVNGILQDTDNPTTFIDERSALMLKPHALIIDVSCDKGMGFSFANPTTFEKPIFVVGNDTTYYAVDHTPTYLWAAASGEISKSLLPYLQDIVDLGTNSTSSETIKRAVDIENGIVRNEKILTYCQG